MTTMIETHGLSKTFRTRRGTVEAVKGSICASSRGDLWLPRAEWRGKTTTMRMLTTLMPPSGGEARIVGHDLAREAALVRERIGYVSQAGGVEDGATGRENLVLQGRLYGQDKATARARTAALLTTLQLDSIADRPGSTYSGGQRRRLDIALGLVHKPALLFLDEPTTGLDPQSRARLWDEVRRLRDEGMTIFLTTHYLDEADALCDRLAIIDDGRIVVEGSPAELKRQIAGDVVTLGLDPTGDVGARAEAILHDQPFVREITRDEATLRLYVEQGESALPVILRLLDGAGLTLKTIALARPTLDDVFLHQTGRSLRETGNG